MDIQTLEAVLQFIKERQEDLNEYTPVGGGKIKRGANSAYNGLILSLRKTIELEQAKEQSREPTVGYLCWETRLADVEKRLAKLEEK